MLKILFPKRSVLVWFRSLIVRDAIPFMLARQADICPLECVSIYILTKTPTSLNILGVLINVGNLAVTIVSRL